MEARVSEVGTAMQVAQKQYERDALFRRCVDAAVHETMPHFDHIANDVDRRDIHHAAVIAARTALRHAIDGDRYLAAMAFERDAAKKMLENMAQVTPGFSIRVKDQTP